MFCMKTVNKHCAFKFDTLCSRVYETYLQLNYTQNTYLSHFKNTQIVR